MALVVVTRYVVQPEDAPRFAEQAREALDALQARPGCRRGHVGRSMDEPDRWLLQTEWDSVGAYRRALSSYDVKMRAVPLMYHAVDEPTAYEVLVAGSPEGLLDGTSDRAADAGWAAPGDNRPDRPAAPAPAPAAAPAAGDDGRADASGGGT